VTCSPVSVRSGDSPLPSSVVRGGHTKPSACSHRRRLSIPAGPKPSASPDASRPGGPRLEDCRPSPAAGASPAVRSASLRSATLARCRAYRRPAGRQLAGGESSTVLASADAGRPRSERRFASLWQRGGNLRWPSGSARGQPDGSAVWRPRPSSPPRERRSLGCPKIAPRFSQAARPAPPRLPERLRRSPTAGDSQRLPARSGVCPDCSRGRGPRTYRPGAASLRRASDARVTREVLTSEASESRDVAADERSESDRLPVDERASATSERGGREA